MKKIFYSIVSISLLSLGSCTKMTEIDDKVKEIQENEKSDAEFLLTRTNAPEAYTLTDEDYELSSDESVAKYKSFSSYQPSKDYLPEILNQLFSGEDTQSMEVTYDYYSKPFVDEDNSRSITDDEYNEMGESYSNFGDVDKAESLIGKMLDRKVYTDVVSTEMTVDYTLRLTNQTRYVQVNDDGTTEVLEYSDSAVEVTDDQYEYLGQGKYKNFYTIEVAQENLLTLATDEGTAPIVYSCSVYSNIYTEYVVYMYNGKNWLVKQSVMPVAEDLNYSKDSDDISDSFWWADPAIKITLTPEDYDSNDITSTYDNFDLRSGKTPGTDIDMRVKMIGDMLDLNHGPIIEDQQYLATYNYYDGANGVGNDRIIKVGGVWIMYIDPIK